MKRLDRLIAEAIKAQITGQQTAENWQYILQRLFAEIDADAEIDTSVAARLKRDFEAQVGKAEKNHKGLPRFTVDRLRPALRKKLDERIVQSLDLIKLRRKEAISNALARFTGWASSVPDMRAKIDMREVRDHIYKPIAQVKYEARRVAIDQSHKLIAAINETIAEDGGAIALIWRSNWRQAGYDYRKDHKERDGKVWIIPGSWAQKAGFFSAKAPRYDQITHVAEEPYCRCYATFLYHLEDIPKSMLSFKGLAYLRKAA